MTYYLKTETEAAMRTALAAALDGFVGADENGDEILVCYTHQWSVDWNISITQTPATFDAEGNITAQPIMESGFFCNIIVSDKDIDTTSIEAIDQQPNMPQRRFA